LAVMPFVLAEVPQPESVATPSESATIDDRTELGRIGIPELTLARASASRRSYNELTPGALGRPRFRYAWPAAR
jgi:hypothetical protein